MNTVSVSRINSLSSISSRLAYIQSCLKRSFATQSANTNDEYQFLERSPLPTMLFQDSLPRLPVPKLQNSCRRYLQSLLPILTDEQHAATRKIVERFETEEGPDLQAELTQINKKNKHTSYIAEMWYDMYLKDRIPIPINYNPFMVLEYDPQPEFNNQAIRSTNLIVSALRFKRSLDARVLFPEVFHVNPKKSDTQWFRRVCKILPARFSWHGAIAFKAFPLDMSQHPWLFGTSRIPTKERDRLSRDDNSKHIIVLRKGHFFALNVIDDNGNIHSPEQIYSSISHILSLSLEPVQHPVSIYTTTDRDSWCDIRNGLIDCGNDASIKKIDTGLFALCLDDESYTREEALSLAASMLHGDGSNRWFDKSFQLIVLKDGLSCVNFEHSWGDGVAVMRLVVEMFKDSNQTHWVSPNTKRDSTDAAECVSEVKFSLTDSLKETAMQLKEKYNEWTNRLSFSVCEYDDMNKNYVKKHALSPDALMQLAIQMTYYRMYGNTVATYESCSTSAFKHGRTETMRSATTDTKNFVNLFHSNSKPSNQDLRSAINQCSATHFKLVKEASMVASISVKNVNIGMKFRMWMHAEAGNMMA